MGMLAKIINLIPAFQITSNIHITTTNAAGFIQTIDKTPDIASQKFGQPCLVFDRYHLAEPNDLKGGKNDPSLVKYLEQLAKSSNSKILDYAATNYICQTAIRSYVANIQAKYYKGPELSDIPCFLDSHNLEQFVIHASPSFIKLLSLTIDKIVTTLQAILNPAKNANNTAYGHIITYLDFYKNSILPELARKNPPVFQEQLIFFGDDPIFNYTGFIIEDTVQFVVPDLPQC